MTSVRVISSHSFGKTVNKRHFVQRFISWISLKKQEVNHTFLQFFLSSSLLFQIGPFTFFFFLGGEGGGGGREKRLSQVYLHAIVNEQKHNSGEKLVRRKMQSPSFDFF